MGLLSQVGVNIWWNLSPGPKGEAKPLEYEWASIPLSPVPRPVKATAFNRLKGRISCTEPGLTLTKLRILRRKLPVEGRVERFIYVRVRWSGKR